MFRLSDCMTCKLFRKTNQGMICDAFPAGIPKEIAFGEKSHQKNVPGDHGIKYQEKKEAPDILKLK